MNRFADRRGAASAQRYVVIVNYSNVLKLLRGIEVDTILQVDNLVRVLEQV